MKDVVWLIQDSGLEFGAVDKVIDALKAENIPYHTVGLRPFDNKFHGLEDLDLEDKIVIPYGSTRFVQLAQLMGLTVYHDPANFHILSWKNQILPYRLLNYLSSVTSLNNLLKGYERFPLFVRPLTDFKSFSGQVVESTKDVKNLVDFNQLNPDLLCVFSKVKDIYQEVRIFVVGRKFVSASQYRLNGILQIQSVDIGNFSHLENGWLPNENCVVDLAKEHGADKWRVLEFNTFNCSGFYDHDVKAVVRAVTDYEMNRRGNQ